MTSLLCSRGHARGPGRVRREQGQSGAGPRATEAQPRHPPWAPGAPERAARNGERPAPIDVSAAMRAAQARLEQPDVERRALALELCPWVEEQAPSRGPRAAS